MLLIAAVALSAALIASVACALASANRAIEDRLDATVGAADLSIKPLGKGAQVPVELIAEVETWPEVEQVLGRIESVLSFTVRKRVYLPELEGRLVLTDQRFSTNALGLGVMVDREFNLRPLELIEGRFPESDYEIVIDALLAEALSTLPTIDIDERRIAGVDVIEPTQPEEGRDPVDFEEAVRWNKQQRVGVGDTVEIVRLFRAAVELKIVGIVHQPPLGGRPRAWMTLETLAAITRQEGRLNEIDILLKEDQSPEDVAEARRQDIDQDRVLLTTTEKVTSGMTTNMRSSQLGFVLATILAFLSASFIILTGLNTGSTERQRELAIVRCIGGTRFQLAAAQLLIGAIIGLLGALLGTPLGVGLAAIGAATFSEELPSGLIISWGGVALAASGSVCAGLIGAAWPAWRASRLSPLQALTVRAQPARVRGVALVGAIGLAGLLYQVLVVGVPADGQVVFWAYALSGLPAMFIGYFLLGVPLTQIVARIASPVLSRLLGLPGHVLSRSVAGSPYQYGFTAGAMMAGLALMVAIWTNGGAFLRDWLDKLAFPDAFVSGMNLTIESQETLDAMPFVENTCAISLHPVDTDIFGVRALQRYKTTFIAFQPDRFVEMTNVTWIQGDQETAVQRLHEGGAVIVAREFLVARGLGVGSTFKCQYADQEYEFEIVGVVTSPGLDVVSKFFNIGKDYHEQSLHAVFGSRRDLIEKFGFDVIHLIQIDLSDDVSDEEALARIRSDLFGAGILDAGSGRMIKEEIASFVTGLLLVFSSVAIVSMLVACFGVANLIVAAIDARRFEFGVLRAIGAPRSLLARLVIGETMLMVITACALGTLMGIQASWADQRLYRLLLGIVLHVRPPPLPIVAGWLIVATLTLGAAAPAIWRLNRRGPRELLSK